MLSGLVVLTAATGAGAADVDLIYSTRAGDTLIGLEKRFLAPPFGWQGLQSHNRIPNPAHLQVGSQLRIPEGWLRVERRSARVLAVQGDATSGGRPLAVGETLEGGAELRTGEGAFVTLLMPDESRLTLQPGSVVRLDKVQGFRGFDGQDTRVYLERGRVETSVMAQRGPAARYQIRTPTAVVGVRGTAFRVGSDLAAGSAQTEVTGGEVRMSASGAGPATALPAGFGVVAKAGAPLPPLRPLLRAPALGGVPAVLERVALQFAFAPVDGAVRYRAQVARDEAFNDVVMDGLFEASPARFAGLPDGDYWLRVRAIDEAGLEGYDVARPFALRARPVPPQPDVPAAATLSWQPVPEAAGYRVQVSRDAAFKDLLIERDSPATSVDTGLPPGAYFWRVASLRGNGQPGPWGDAGAFAVRRVPGPVALEVYNSRLRFAWPAEPGGRIYEFQLARDPAFGELLVDQRIGEPAVTVPALPGGSYALRVRAVDADGTVSPWSAVQTLSSHLVLPWRLSAPPKPGQ